jgi:hypothetical protein
MESTTTTEGFSMKIDKVAIADVIERAVDLYESEQIEWCQGGFFNANDSDLPSGHYQIISACAWGSLLLAATEGNVKEAWDLTCDRVKQVTDPAWTLANLAKMNLEAYLGVSEIPRYNDEWGRTKQEVIEAMKGTAKEPRNHV